MKLLMYGAKGWIATQFIDYLHTATISKDWTIISGTARVDDINSVRLEIDSVTPTHVMSLIGRTSGVTDGVEFNTIDYLEQPGCLVENIRDNYPSWVELKNPTTDKLNLHGYMNFKSLLMKNSNIFFLKKKAN